MNFKMHKQEIGLHSLFVQVQLEISIQIHFKYNFKCTLLHQYDILFRHKFPVKIQDLQKVIYILTECVVYNIVYLCKLYCIYCQIVVLHVHFNIKMQQKHLILLYFFFKHYVGKPYYTLFLLKAHQLQGRIDTHQQVLMKTIGHTEAFSKQ